MDILGGDSSTPFRGGKIGLLADGCCADREPVECLKSRLGCSGRNVVGADASTIKLSDGSLFALGAVVRLSHR